MAGAGRGKTLVRTLYLLKEYKIITLIPIFFVYDECKYVEVARVEELERGRSVVAVKRGVDSGGTL